MDVSSKPLTRLWEEEEKNALEASRDSSKRDHPPPAPVRVCECRIDAVGNDLATGNRNHVHDDHTASLMGGGELLDVERGNARSNADADANDTIHPHPQSPFGLISIYIRPCFRLEQTPQHGWHKTLLPPIPFEDLMSPPQLSSFPLKLDPFLSTG